MLFLLYPSCMTVEAQTRMARLAICIQAPATLAVLLLVPTNVGKLFALLALWMLSFGRLRQREWMFFLGISVFFTVMNAAALAQGIFRFAEPDLLGMPVWELVMWGFYTLHTVRLIGGPVPRKRRQAVWPLAILFALCFATISDPKLLLAASSFVLLVALVIYHERHDLMYAGYMLALGALFEYAGVHFGLWSYPDNPPGGVPLWFITMWGGVGLFLRRLALPIISPPEAVLHGESHPS